MSDNFDKEIKEIFLDEIIPNRFQPRLNFDQKSLIELSDSIKQHGIIQPLILRKLGDKYEIIAGERRYKASQIAGLVKVPAIIVDFDDNKSAEVAMVENLHRKEMTALEEARAFKKLLQKGITQEQLGTRLGKSQSYIANKLRLLSLNEIVQDALMKEQISERHARSLLTVKDLEEQTKLLEEIINKKLTVKETDDIIKERFGEEIIEDISIPKTDSTIQIEKPIEPNRNIETLDNEQLIIEDTQQIPKPIEINLDNIITSSETNNVSNINNFNLNDLKKVEEQQINAPKPFVLIDQNNNVEAFTIPNITPEPHNNVDINPQRDLINKLSNVDSNLEAQLFKDTSTIKSSPYVIPKIDIEDKYLVPGSSLEPQKTKPDLNNNSNNNSNSFNIDSIIKQNHSEVQVNSTNRQNIDGGFNIEQLLKPDVVQTPPQTEIKYQEETVPQNRFIVDIKEPEEEPNQDIANAKNIIKKVVESVKNSGVKIDFEEFDFERLYQIIIKIEK